LREMGARFDRERSVIRVNLRNLRTIVKAGTMGPLITLIMDARNLQTARACGREGMDSEVKE
jgi:hypothetical protein